MRAGPIDAAGVNELLRSTDNWILTGSAVFRRECVIWAGGFDPRLSSFADGFVARKIALRYGFYFEPKIVASWVVFPDSVSRRRREPPQVGQARSVMKCSTSERVSSEVVSL